MVKCAFLCLANVVASERALLNARPYTIDHDNNVFKDSEGRQRFWHGSNWVEKNPPYYPTIPDEDIQGLREMGAYAVRLGVMMPGMYPEGPTLNTTYLDKIEEIVDRLHKNGFETILEVHQDVLAPKVCGEGTPEWMLEDVSSLHALPVPLPASLKPSDIDPKTGDPTNCDAVGPLKFIGWSMWYMTDACGKAFQQVFDGESVMAKAFEQYWHDVATRFKDHPGVLAYELMNEPWIGDWVSDPSLLFEAGKAEIQVGKYMQRMHDVVRRVDPDTMILYAPAEVNNRAQRHVGYERGFLPEAGMAYHVYCITGTDGDGPTNPIQKELCHFNDAFQMSHREQDLRRLQTAGFITEFGAVHPSKTGLAEIHFVLDYFDAMQPPANWAFWGICDLVLHQKEPHRTAAMKALARPYPRAVAGKLHSIHFERSTGVFEMQYTAVPGNTTLFLPKKYHYPNGYRVAMYPSNAVAVVDEAEGIRLSAANIVTVAIRVEALSVEIV